MPRDQGRPARRSAPILALVVAIAVVATLIGIYVYSQWEQPPAVQPQGPVLEGGGGTPQQ